MRTGMAGLALIVSGLLGGCERPPDDATITQRVVEHFRRTMTSPPGLTFKVERLEEGDVPGWRKGTLSVVMGAQRQDIAFHVSHDGRFLFRGEVVDLTVDPLEAARRAITLERQPVRGAAAAPVTIVEFGDFQCPYSARLEPVLARVLEAYAGRVRIVFKSYPLRANRPWAEDGALAGECAFEQGADAFWKVHDALFAQQTEIDRANLRDRLAAIASSAGLDGERLQRCLDEGRGRPAMLADEKEGAGLGVTSTPTLFVDGRRLAGVPSFEQVKALVDDALSSAR